MIILGSGMSGLLAAYKLKKFRPILITDNLYGAINFKLHFAPNFLYKSNEIKELLKELDLSTTTRKIPVLYIYKKNVENVLTEEMKKEYWKKTRGEPIPKNFPENFMSEQKQELTVYNVSPEQLCRTLISHISNEIEIIQERIISIQLIDSRLVLFNENYNKVAETNLLISTIPARTFSKIAAELKIEELKNLESTPLYIYTSISLAPIQKEILYYVVDEKEPITRLYFSPFNTIYIESLIELSFLDSITNKMTLIDGKFKKEKNLFYYKLLENCTIFFLGRYAQFKQLKTQDILKEIKAIEQIISKI